MEAQFDDEQRMHQQEAAQLRGVHHAFPQTQEKSFEIGTLGMRWSPPRGALLLPALNQRPIEESKKGVLADFGSSKMGSQALMQVAQAKLPAANLARGWSDLRRCGIMLLLHVFLVSDGRLEQERFVLLTTTALLKLNNTRV